MGRGFRIKVGHGLVAVGNLGRSAVAVVDHHHGRDVVQLDRRRQVVPEGLVPAAEFGGNGANGSPGNIELAVIAHHGSAVHLAKRQLGKPRVDASEQHGIVMATGRLRAHGQQAGETQCGPGGQKGAPAGHTSRVAQDAAVAASTVHRM